MSEFKFKLRKAGVRELLKSKEMMQILKEEGKKIAERCGEGYTSDIYVGKIRANSMVYPQTRKARRDNMENNTILKAVR